MPRAPLATVLTLLALVGVACSANDPDPRPSDPSVGAPADDIAAVATRCTDLLNRRDAEVFTRGRDAALRVLTLSWSDDPPADDVRAALRADLTAARDAFAADLDTLRTGPQPSGWDVVLAPVENTIAGLDTRLAAVTAAAWPPADLAPGQAFAAASDDDLAAAGLAALAGRDCAVLANVAGPDPAAPAFAAAAASTCRAIADRRRTSGFAGAATRTLDLVLAVHQGKAVAPTDDDRAAVRAVRDEWQRTHDDLAAVPADDLVATEAWAAVVALASDRVAGFDRRVAALDSGDAAEIEAAFAPQALGAPGWDWAAVGLGQRDCRALRA
ncbi:hypothetical protein [Pimelobacter sp. 30-1]|uniref:hypothetical protein n=1 Tax=Pimelobacter sp. 30-1 TaxID=2004991 RepID=UPI001C03C68B|nr:hypothetical protein [Pimelobacter sp. 30-1]MBU2694606.1 hypothetical protein [Pimelobacter sp. 30-1]